MSDEYAENKLKLLGILYDLYSGERQAPADGPPFTIGEGGSVVLHQNLADILEKNHHSDFVVWAKENIVDLS
jgi:hypothetical protein